MMIDDYTITDEVIERVIELLVRADRSCVADEELASLTHLTHAYTLLIAHAMTLAATTRKEGGGGIKMAPTKTHTIDGKSPLLASLANVKPQRQLEAHCASMDYLPHKIKKSEDNTERFNLAQSIMIIAGRIVRIAYHWPEDNWLGEAANKKPKQRKAKQHKGKNKKRRK